MQPKYPSLAAEKGSIVYDQGFPTNTTSARTLSRNPYFCGLLDVNYDYDSDRSRVGGA
jgi:hypothetical protein